MQNHEDTSFAQRVAAYRAAAVRFELAWVATLIGGLSIVVWMTGRCDCRLPDGKSIALAVLFFGYLLGALFFGHKVDLRLRRDGRLYCPECERLFDKVAVRRFSHNGQCTHCHATIGDDA